MHGIDIPARSFTVDIEQQLLCLSVIGLPIPITYKVLRKLTMLIKYQGSILHKKMDMGAFSVNDTSASFCVYRNIETCMIKLLHIKCDSDNDSGRELFREFSPSIVMKDGNTNDRSGNVVETVKAWLNKQYVCSNDKCDIFPVAIAMKDIKMMLKDSQLLEPKVTECHKRTFFRLWLLSIRTNGLPDYLSDKEIEILAHAACSKVQSVSDLVCQALNNESDENLNQKVELMIAQLTS